ncbi:hypothetical protein [Corallococcus sp. CA049B]|uniref:hypothetical protein n=1 Tax=Corallococcus sp. CA049B TaxID=2316730 RepID=UPI0011C39842|nr:hypothetical protein [Corallococcus sp. CA049B]
MSNQQDDLILAAQKLVPVHKLSTSLAAVSEPLAAFLHGANLPTEGVLVEASERHIVLNAFHDAISILPDGDRKGSFYLSKYVVAISLGLFDAALNYLWNETIAALRRLVARTDLEYFYDAVEKRPDVRKKLQTVDDLPEIGEALLIEGCYRIGLLTNVNHERLKHVNFMRNHASAAHPNQNEINGAEMVGWLSNCLRYAITAEPSHEVVQVKKLLEQLRANPILPGDAPIIKNGILHLPRERIDDLLWTLFGIYCDMNQTAQTRANIELIAKTVWGASAEARKYEVGIRYASFVKHAENGKKALAHQFLTATDGLAYRSEDVLVVELIDKLRTLYGAHVEYNNFYSERSHARSLEQSLPPNGQVPVAVRSEWVKVICVCYFGNGLGYKEGVDEAAVPYYVVHIKNFSETEVVEFLHLFGDAQFVSDLHLPKPDKRARDVAAFLKARTKHVHALLALDQIVNAAPKILGKIHSATAFQQALAQLPR